VNGVSDRRRGSEHRRSEVRSVVGAFEGPGFKEDSRRAQGDDSEHGARVEWGLERCRISRVQKECGVRSVVSEYHPWLITWIL
jgi:hypothetical protein